MKVARIILRSVAPYPALEDNAVVVRCRLKVTLMRQWSVRREFLRRFKQALDRPTNTDAPIDAAAIAD